MHLIDAGKGVMGMSAIVGTTIANAVGHSYALRYRRQGGIVAAFFGDGATEEGVFSESLNFAVLKKLPVLFVCENNGYAIHAPQSRRQGSTDICSRARAHGMHAWQLESNDIIPLADAIHQIVAQVRAGNGPAFIEVKTYRWREHVGPNEDYNLGYRGPEEARPWKEADPLPRLAKMLPDPERQPIEEAVEREIAEAFAFAKASPFPGREELMTDTYEEVAA